MGINSWFINQQTLVGALEHVYFSIQLGDELIFLRGRYTTNQIYIDDHIGLSELTKVSDINSYFSPPTSFRKYLPVRSVHVVPTMVLQFVGDSLV